MSAILNECGLALEKMQLEEAKNEISLQAQQEQLRSNLLRTISHDLRTPLTSISGNAEILLANAEVIDDNQKNKLYADIYDDSMWLINLVENLLSITRIENGNMVLNMQPELLEEVITEAISHMSRRKLEHQIIVEQDNDFLIAKMDSKLIIQVLINIIDNAIKYTPVNSVIKVSVTKENQRAVIEISDNGDGITNEAKEKLFEMFYTANSSSLDGRRGMGLGLTLCKSIITAHGGTFTVRDNKPQGTIFRFDLACQTSPQPFNEE
jgi:two-component system sensor histidine kinase KdpD